MCAGRSARRSSPGLLAAVAIVYAIRQTPAPHARERAPVRIRICPVLHGQLGRLMAAVAAFETGNIAATLFILRATQLLTPHHGAKTATTLALVLYTLYNLTATLASLPAGRAADRGPIKVLAAGVMLAAAAYAGCAATGPNLIVLALPFAAAGLAIGCVETAENSAVAALAPSPPSRVGVRAARHYPSSREPGRKRYRRGAVDRDLPGHRVRLPHGVDAARPRWAGTGSPLARLRCLNPQSTTQPGPGQTSACRWPP